jgi:hypothetical protein
MRACCAPHPSAEPAGTPVIRVDSAIRGNIFQLGVNYRLGAATY